MVIPNIFSNTYTPHILQTKILTQPFSYATHAAHRQTGAEVNTSLGDSRRFFGADIL